MTFKPQFSPYAESLLVHFRRVESLKSESVQYPSVDLGVRQLCDLELLLNRAFYPLQGFMTRDEYESVLEHMRLPDGTVNTCHNWAVAYYSSLLFTVLGFAAFIFGLILQMGA
jgi:hypothetical protein